MKRLLFLLLFTLQVLGLNAQNDSDSVALSPDELWVKTLQHRLDSITDKVKKQHYTAGYCIMDLTDDSVLYRYNAQKMLKPASTQKLFVATTALHDLSADYSFRTCLYIDGNIATDSVGRRYLKGDICVRGCYDPTLQVSDIQQFCNKMVSLSIDSVDGKIIADNRVKLDAKKVKDVPKYFAEELYKGLLNIGIKFSSSSPCSSSSTPLTRGWNIATIYTPLKEVLKTMLKRSNNDYAESVLLNLCSMGRNDDWSYDKCKQKVLNMVEEVADSTTDYRIFDGSGLSYSNKCTPELLAMLLRYDYHDSDIFHTLYENLPIGGVDGTLSKRMKSAPVYNNVRAKTGTLNDTSTLAGYVTASNGHVLVFAIMVNGLSGGVAVGKELQNHICEEIAR